MRNKKLQKGYTLVELLAVTAIIVIVSGVIAGILYSTLRGSDKTKITNDVAQNGNYALSVISNTILSGINITKIGGNIISDCTASPTYPTGNSIEVEQSDGSLILFSCIQDTIASESGTITTNLIDTNNVKVDAASCSFTCKQSNSDPYALPIVDIEFIVSQKTGITSENKATASFNTSVTMRNFGPK